MKNIQSSFISKGIKFAPFIAKFTLVEYALTKPPVPSFIPPKYLTTKTPQFIKFAQRKAFKLGGPLVPFGSPSSL